MQRIKKTYCSKTIHRIKKFFHTEKYKLNLIESSDPFLPEGLNENTQKIEDVLAEKMEGPMADLEQRVAALEGRKISIGQFRGNTDSKLPQSQQTEQFIQLGFRPSGGAVWYKTTGAYDIYVFHEEDADSPIRLAENGFYARKYLNFSGYTCIYVFHA